MAATISCGVALALFSACSDKAFFDEGEHAWSYPRAFVSDKDIAEISIGDSSQLAKSIRMPAGQPVRFIGFITNPRPTMQLEGRWTFGDGVTAIDTFDTSFIIQHVFADTGFYTAFFTTLEGAGNSLYDSVTVTVR